MSGRSTRTKIRFQVAKAARAMDLVMEHLAKAEIYADKRSSIINDKMPKLIVMCQGVKEVLIQFRQEL